MSTLPDDVYQHVNDNWGSSGVAGAEYAYGILADTIRVLEDEVDGFLLRENDVDELFNRIEEAVRILNSAN